MHDYPPEDCYTTLSVDPDASEDFIKSRWKQLNSVFHPDLLADDPPNRLAAEEKLKQINAAYEILKDKTRRKAYDHWRKAGGKSEAETPEEQQRPPRLVATPAHLDFGKIQPGRSTTRRVTIANLGGRPREIRLFVKNEPSPFTVDFIREELPIELAITACAAESGAGLGNSLEAIVDGVPQHLADLTVSPSSNLGPFENTTCGSAPVWAAAFVEWILEHPPKDLPKVVRKAAGGLLTYFAPLFGCGIAGLLFMGANAARGGQSLVSMGLGWATFTGLLYALGSAVVMVTLLGVCWGVAGLSWAGRVVAMFCAYRFGVWAIHSFRMDWQPMGAWFFCVVVTIVAELVDVAVTGKS